MDDECIDCSLCQELAPENFSRSDAQDYAFVSKQAITKSEEGQCQDALNTCPIDAIGSDCKNMHDY